MRRLQIVPSEWLARGGSMWARGARAPRIDTPASLATASNALGFDLYERVRTTPGNLAFSPLSIELAFSMLTAGARGDTEAEMEERVMGALRAHFKPEFLNRVDDVMIFKQLDRSQITHIAELQLARVEKLLAERRISLELSPEAQQLIADRGYDPQYGARPLKRVIQRMVQDPLAIQILEGRFPEGSKIRAGVNAAGDALEFSKN